MSVAPRTPYAHCPFSLRSDKELKAFQQSVIGKRKRTWEKYGRFLSRKSLQNSFCRRAGHRPKSRRPDRSERKNYRQSTPDPPKAVGTPVQIDFRASLFHKHKFERAVKMRRTVQDRSMRKQIISASFCGKFVITHRVFSPSYFQRAQSFRPKKESALPDDNYSTGKIASQRLERRRIFGRE